MFLKPQWKRCLSFRISTHVCLWLLITFSSIVTSNHPKSFAIHCDDEQCSNKWSILDRLPCEFRGQNDNLNYFWVTCDSKTKRSVTFQSVTDILDDLQARYHELHPLKRVKRDLRPTFNDPLFKEQWYFNEEGDGGYDLNVKSAWAKGYTGKGVVVSILDDGIQTNHPDLYANYDQNASTDINDDDDDPMPRDNGDNKHGTRCAGEVAAMANNDYCGVGIAYEANIGGVRMLDGTVNDNVESKALGLKPNYVDIYSASWGPEDDGKTVDGPGPLARRQFIHGVTHGRHGKGSIFIWASGNGGRHNDSCNCDGYTNSIFTLSISSATQGGYKPWYLEECSSTLTTTYSSGTPGHDKSVTTVDMDARLRRDHICTVEHTGTSASAPLAAGCAALALQANPDLSWRDMQYMVVLTSRPEPLMSESGWFKNGANRYVSHKFGYGLIDAGEMVNLAEVWIPVPPQHICKSPEVVADKKIEAAPYSNLELSMNVNGCNNTLNEVQYLEHVQCKVTLRFFPRGNLRILLTSPAGTTSTLLFERSRDVISSNFDDWPFMSVHFWGERPHGKWKLRIQNKGSRNINQNGILKKWQLIFYGTAINPIRIKKSKVLFNNHKNSFSFPQYLFSDYSPQFGVDDIYSASNIQESVIEIAQNKKKSAGVTDCDNPSGCVRNKRKCSEDEGRTVENCVETCPDNSYEDERHVCVTCHDSCSKCNGPYQKDCLSCSPSFFYLVDLKICMQHCPDGYYENVTKKSCIPCASNCASCPESPEICTRCHYNLVNFNNQCRASCPVGTFETDDNRCRLCHHSCETCSGSQNDQCFTCHSGSYELNNQCVKKCPVRTYANHRTLECRNCPVGCLTCTNSTHCLTCDQNWIPFNGTNCVPKTFDHCKQGEYVDGNHECKQCHLTCKSCTSAGRQSCLSCASTLILQRSQCVSECSDGYFLNEDSNVCDTCPHTCTTCSTLESCSDCKTSLLLQNGRCLPACANGYYSDRGVCTQCDKACETCSGPQFDQCVSCFNNTILMNGKCVEKCPMGFYNNFESTKCMKCDKNYSCFNDDLESKSGDEIPAKPETIIKSDDRLQLQYVPVSDFSFKHIYVVLVAVITVIGVILTFLLLRRKYKLKSKCQKRNTEIMYKIVRTVDDDDDNDEDDNDNDDTNHTKC